MRHYYEVIALGLVVGEHAYLRDTFNCVDFLVVLLSILVRRCSLSTSG